MKKILSLFLALLILAISVLTLVSCNDSGDPSKTSSTATTPIVTTPPTTTTGGSDIGSGASPGVAGDGNWTERY